MFKIKADLWVCLQMRGINLKKFRFKVHVSDLTWRGIISGKALSRMTLSKLMLAVESDAQISYEEFHEQFVESYIDTAKNRILMENENLRSILNKMEYDGVFNFSDVARYLGVSRQYISNFISGRSISNVKRELLRNYLTLHKVIIPTNKLNIAE